MGLCLTEGQTTKTGPLGKLGQPVARAQTRPTGCPIAAADLRLAVLRRIPGTAALKRCPVSPIIKTMQWEIHVCRSCGDYGLGGWEELLHLPNQRCPGIKDPEAHVFRVLVTDRHGHGRRRLRSTARRGRCH
jgi:hypothetical protein